MRTGRLTLALIAMLLLSGAAAADRPKRAVDLVPARPLSGWSETGRASWYGGYFNGRLTASGVRYDMHAPMAAHKTLKFGTTVRVTNLDNGRSTYVIVRDRGPFIAGRVIDLSHYSADQLGMLHAGTARVRLEALR